MIDNKILLLQESHNGWLKINDKVIIHKKDILGIEIKDNTFVTIHIKNLGEVSIDFLDSEIADYMLTSLFMVL